jgi:hypothetical protein
MDGTAQAINVGFKLLLSPASVLFIPQPQDIVITIKKPHKNKHKLL